MGRLSRTCYDDKRIYERSNSNRSKMACRICPIILQIWGQRKIVDIQEKSKNRSVVRQIPRSERLAYLSCQEEDLQPEQIIASFRSFIIFSRLESLLKFLGLFITQCALYFVICENLLFDCFLLLISLWSFIVNLGNFRRSTKNFSGKAFAK